MRQIFQFLTEIAAEVTRESDQDPTRQNERIHQVREGFQVMDNVLSNPRGDNAAKLREAMVVADFPLYFGTAISRAFNRDYPVQAGSWSAYTYADETPDFRDVERYRTSEFGLLNKRSELQETSQEAVSESQIKFSVDEYSKAFSLSWKVLMNDDMGEIRRFPSKLLRAATRWEDSFVSNLYDNATAQAALIALGTNYADMVPLTVAGVKTAYSRFMARVDSKGLPLNIVPRFIVTSPIHELTCREIFAGLDNTSNSPTPAVTKGLLQWKADPYIGDNDDWYLFADPAEIAAVSVARLRGYDRPQVYMKQPDMVPFSGGGMGTPSWLTGSFENGLIEFMVLDILGGWEDASYKGITDYQGIFFSTGDDTP